MRRTRALLAWSLLVHACVHAPERAPEPKPERNENLPAFFPNQPVFDVAVCAPAPSAPVTLNEGSLLALLLEQRPQVLECLVPLEHRERENRTQVHVETTVGSQGALHAVSGENLSAAGRRCIEEVLRSRLSLRPRAADAAPVRAVAEFTQGVGPAQSLVEPIGWQAVFAARIRRALPSWCGCYAPHLAGPVPPLLGAYDGSYLRDGHVTLTRMLHLQFVEETPAPLLPLATCLQERATSLPFDDDRLAQVVPATLRLRHLNTAVVGAPAVLQPELHFFQLEGERNAYAAAAARAWGRRLEAAQTYSARVAAYEASRAPEAIGELQWRCALVVQASRAWVASLEAQREADVRLGALVGELTARNTATPEASATVAEAQQRTATAMSAATQVLREDEAACPKSHEEPAESAGN